MTCKDNCKILCQFSEENKDICYKLNDAFEKGKLEGRASAFKQCVESLKTLLKDEKVWGKNDKEKQRWYEYGIKDAIEQAEKG